MRYTFVLILVVLFCGAMTIFQEESNSVVPDSQTEVESVDLYKLFFQSNWGFRAEGFDFPVGKPDAVGYYNAQKFGENNHLGDDWNGEGGGNSDFGDPVYCIANGYVSEVYDAGAGWGNVIRVIHQTSDTVYIESLYAHLETMEVSVGVGIKKGERLGTIGNANGAYWAHLHLEVRTEVNLPLGGGYSSDTEGYIDPTKYIKGNRRVMWKKSR